MVPTVKHGGGSVLMWGCMSAAGVGELHFIDGIMNSQMYCSILKEKMLPSLCALGRHALFQHAGLCKGSCELPATLLEVSFPPSRISTPGGVQGKPGGLSKTPATRPTVCSLCCPQGDVSVASDPALAD